MANSINNINKAIVRHSTSLLTNGRSGFLCLACCHSFHTSSTLLSIPFDYVDEDADLASDYVDRDLDPDHIDEDADWDFGYIDEDADLDPGYIDEDEDPVSESDCHSDVAYTTSQEYSEGLEGTSHTDALNEIPLTDIQKNNKIKSQFNARLARLAKSRRDSKPSPGDSKPSPGDSKPSPGDSKPSSGVSKPSRRENVKGFYGIIRSILDRGPIEPGRTQIDCESACLNHINVWFRDFRNSVNPEDYAMGGPKVTKWFIETRSDLIDRLEVIYINRKDDLYDDEAKLEAFMNKFDKSTNKYSTKLTNIRLAHIIDILGIEYTADSMLSLVSTIITNVNSKGRCYDTDLAIDLGNGLLNDALRALYRWRPSRKPLKRNALSDRYLKCPAVANTAPLKLRAWVDLYKHSGYIRLFNTDHTNSNVFAVHVGAILIQYLKDAELLCGDLEPDKERKMVGVLYPTEAVKLAMGSDFNNVRALPANLPMVEVPRKYTKDEDGGYMLNGVRYRKGILVRNKFLKEASKIADINKVYDMVNAVSATPYCINTQLLDYLEAHGRMDGIWLKDPSLDFSDAEMLKLCKYKKRAAYKEFKSADSAYRLQEEILAIANVYRDVDKIYFPVRLDFRGRIYCLPLYLNYQGTELAKALLLFSNKSKLYFSDRDSLDHFYCYGANCFGISSVKVSRTERIEWVNDHHEDIMNFDNNVLISKAKNKYLFIAFAIEYKNLHIAMKSEKVSFVYTQLPIQLDATCNGYQHLSMLSRDYELGRNLNLLGADKDSVPRDFYALLIGRVIVHIKKLEDDLSKELLNSTDLDKKVKAQAALDSCRRILAFNPTRSLIKKPIMIDSYNASVVKSADALKDLCYCMDDGKFGDGAYSSKKRTDSYNSWRYVLNKGDDPKIYLLNADFIKIVNVMKEVLKEDYPRLTTIRRYLSRVASFCNRLGMGISFTVPSGLIVNQGYLTDDTFQLRPFQYNRKSLTISKISDAYDKRKQVRALMPNFIHSLDAASLAMLHEKFRVYSSSMFTVHDCYAVPIPLVEVLIELLQGVYIDIYSDAGYLRDYDKCIIKSIQETYGDSIEFYPEGRGKRKYKHFVLNGKPLRYPDVEDVFKDATYSDIFDALTNRKAIYAID